MLYVKVIDSYPEVWRPLRLREHRCEECDLRVTCLIGKQCKRSVHVVQHPIGWNIFRNNFNEIYAMCYLDDEVEACLVEQFGQAPKPPIMTHIDYRSYILGYPFDV